MSKLKIGGIDCELIITYRQWWKFLKVYNRTYYIAKKKADKIKADVVIPNDFFFWVIWKCLVKKGIWPLKKPFHSMGNMIKKIRKDEYRKIVDFVGNEILGNMEEGKDSKNG